MQAVMHAATFTAHTLAEMGQEVTLITDGMAAAMLISERKEVRNNPCKDISIWVD